MALPLIHHPAYDATTVPDQHRFPMRKYALVARKLQDRGFAFEVPAPALRHDLIRVHAPSYVDAVLAADLPRTISRRIGFAMTPAIAERSTASCGGTLHAGQRALETGAAISLAGGSHHADRTGGAGFCVFNDVAVAAAALLSTDRVRRILVVDLDVHQGDGTARIFAEDSRVFTLSVHCQDNWPREKPPSDMDVALSRGTDDAGYLAALSVHLPAAIGQFAPDLIFYNAGVDPHMMDRLGLLNLSDDGLKRRDHYVATEAAQRGIPICGVLGGGYDRNPHIVAARHLFLIDAFLDVFKPSQAI